MAAPMNDESSMPSWFYSLSNGQITFFIAYIWTLILWGTSEYLFRNRTLAEEAHEDEESRLLEKGGKAPAASSTSAEEDAAPAATKGLMDDALQSGLVRCIVFDLEAIKKQRAVLKAMAEFGTLMCWYFLCDRTPAFASAEKSYTRDTFLFVYLAITATAFGASITPIKAPALLNRPQTEEWKGWMQVGFLLYHYFEAREAYNAIRVFIAAYVWMTGYGNFMYYYKTGDYCIGRFAQMMWRLNFLVFFACIVLQNSYMLYYICPMHTIFTVLVYASLGIANHLNKNHIYMGLKIIACVAFIIIFWDMKVVFYTIWSPFKFLVGYVDPRKPGLTDSLYEWYFRSSLDRFIWIYGMLCAWMQPHISKMFHMIDATSVPMRYTLRSVIVMVVGVAAYFYWIHIFSLPKLEYNEVHPYTSWIPISLFIILRNLTPTLQLNSLRMYGWLGCITLETYISQFHIWLNSGIADGQPKYVLSLLPGYPLLNFALCSAIYIFVSHRLFELTNTLKNAAVPHSDNRLLGRNTIMLAGLGLFLYVSTTAVTTIL